MSDTNCPRCGAEKYVNAIPETDMAGNPFPNASEFSCGSTLQTYSDFCREREAHNKTVDFYRNEIAQISQPLYCLHRHCERFGVEIGQRISEVVPRLLEAFEKAESECKKLRAERDEAMEAIRQFYKAKGRFNSQIACAKMFEIVGLPADYPVNYQKKEGGK